MTTAKPEIEPAAQMDQTEAISAQPRILAIDINTALAEG